VAPQPEPAARRGPSTAATLGIPPGHLPPPASAACGCQASHLGISPGLAVAQTSTAPRPLGAGSFTDPARIERWSTSGWSTSAVRGSWSICGCTTPSAVPSFGKGDAGQPGAGDLGRARL